MLSKLPEHLIKKLTQDQIEANNNINKINKQVLSLSLI